MNDFEPSQNFVSSTMDKISAYQKEKDNPRLIVSEHPILFTVFRHSISAGSVVFAVFNLIRLYFAVYKPIFCF